MVLDSHTHAWGPPSRAHPWVNGPLVDDVADYSVPPVYRADDLLADMDRVGIEEAVVVGFPLPEWTDNHYVYEVAARERLHGIVMADPFAADAADRLREAMAHDGVLGFRLGALCPYDRMWETFDTGQTWLRDAIAEEAFWEAARETGARVQILADTTQLDQALELVETYPELTYLFDHYGHADPDQEPDSGAFSRFRDFAEYDVAVKVSETPHHSEGAYPYTDLHDHVRWLVDTLGRERVVWGSDFPNVSDVCEYERSLSWLDEVESLSTRDREWLTGRAFRDIAEL